ncbi:MAG: EAL domain-containing protein [Sideroxyarcus sp.]|nr:EAL domain-containing protein [Sideroxyarcus sp.]
MLPVLPSVAAPWKLDYKGRFLRVTLWLVVLAAGLLGVYHLFVTPPMAIVNFAIVLVCFASLLLLKHRPHKVEVIADLMLGALFAGASAVYLFLTDNSIRLAVFFPFVAVAFHLKGGQIGVFWLLASVLTILGGHFLPWFLGGYSLFEIVAGCLYLSILFALLASFEKGRAEQALRESSQRLCRIFENIPTIAVQGYSSDGTVVYWNPASESIYGYTQKEALGKNLVDLIIPQPMQKAVRQSVTEMTDSGVGIPAAELMLKRKDGKLVPVYSSYVVVSLPGQKAVLYRLDVDLTERKLHEKQLEHIAHHDALTGVPDRVLLADRMAQALARTKREKELLAVCYLDLDGFKSVNDNFGHEAGDQVLVEITRRIKETIREDDTVARIGGDEFVVLLVGLQAPEECVSSLHRLLEAISQPIALHGASVRVSASIGVALYPEDNQDTDTLLHHADQAMYIAKQSGKNRYHLFDAINDQRARTHHALLQQIRRGLAQGEFELYYQPKVDLALRRMVGAEALIRWHHPQRGLLQPDEFLRVIENTELEIKLGNWVIASACAQMRQWHQHGRDVEVSINISAYHLQSADFINKLRGEMQHCCLQGGSRCLQVEVLETVALEDIARVGEVIKTCREFGVGFALDDFGTGYSSLTCLKSLEVDALKIDQSFVRLMLEENGAHAIVQGIIALAHAFNRTVVAEGVEHEAHLQALLQMGCHVVQGYGIAQAMPASQLLEWSAREWPPTAA